MQQQAEWMQLIGFLFSFQVYKYTYKLRSLSCWYWREKSRKKRWMFALSILSNIVRQKSQCQCSCASQKNESYFSPNMKTKFKISSTSAC